MHISIARFSLLKKINAISTILVYAFVCMYFENRYISARTENRLSKSLFINSNKKTANTILAAVRI